MDTYQKNHTTIKIVNQQPVLKIPAGSTVTRQTSIRPTTSIHPASGSGDCDHYHSRPKPAGLRVPQPGPGENNRNQPGHALAEFITALGVVCLILVLGFGFVWLMIEILAGGG